MRYVEFSRYLDLLIAVIITMQPAYYMHGMDIYNNKGMS